MTPFRLAAAPGAALCNPIDVFRVREPDADRIALYDAYERSRAIALAADVDALRDVAAALVRHHPPVVLLLPVPEVSDA